jgi:hypothetical protein
MSDEKDLLIASLEEAIDLLQEELTRHKNALRIQRIINKSLREKLNVAHSNDENFKNFCQSDIVDAEDSEGGLPELES